MSDEPNPKLGQTRRKRPVLIVVEKWPDGTMALKFGSALMSALGQRQDEATLMQLGPERIFKVETDVSEHEFRLALKARDVSHHGRIHFAELITGPRQHQWHSNEFAVAADGTYHSSGNVNVR